MQENFKKNEVRLLSAVSRYFGLSPTCNCRDRASLVRRRATLSPVARIGAVAAAAPDSRLHALLVQLTVLWSVCRGRVAARFDNEVKYP